MIVSRAAAAPNGALSANIASLLGGKELTFNPSSGVWSEKLPGLPGLGPYGPAGSGRPQPSTAAVCEAAYQACHAGAYIGGKLDPELEAKCQQTRANCLAGRKLDAGLNLGAGGCQTCGLNDVPACIDCAWTYIAHAGIEIGLVGLVLLGVYLTFK